jgi:hypothetical protein
MNNNREYTKFEELEKLSDKELEDLVIKGSNLHIHTSRASVAKRILDARKQDRQIKKINAIANQAKKSNKELLDLTEGLNEIVKLLNFFKKNWFPKQSVWVKVGMFLLGTVILGIVINLISDAIAKFLFRW